MFDILKKIYALLPRARQKQLLWLALGMFVMSLVELGLAGAISLLGVALAAPDSLEKIGPLWKVFHMLPSFGEGIPQSLRLLIFVLGMVCVATALKNAMTALMTYWQGALSQAVSWDIGVRIFDNYLHAPYVWHTQHNPSELGGYLGWRANAAGYFMGALQVASQLGIMCFLMAGAFVMAPVVSLMLYGVTAFGALLIYKAAQRRARETGEEVAQLSIGVGRVVHSALHGIREVQIYDQQTAFHRGFAAYAAPTIRASAQQGIYSPMPHWFLETVGMLLLFGAVLLMASRGDSVASVTGTLTLMAAISWRLLPALNKIVAGVLQLKSNITPVQTLLTNYVLLPRVEAKGQQVSFTQALELRDVSFRYPEAKGEALQHVSLSISKGSMVGFIGLSGAGKSTLVGVLTGLLAPGAGVMSVDGKPAKPSPGFLKIGYVPQNPYIIDAPLAENVAFCDWGRPLDEARVRQCCRMAAMDFLDDLPHGIHTVLGDRGLRLSGGQVQRVAIARALYGDPDILLFDEATSALDGAAEAAIQDTILSLRKDMTIVIVAHRLTTVQGCDVLYWLEGGKIFRQGRTDEVLPEYEQFLRADKARQNGVGRG